MTIQKLRKDLVQRSKPGLPKDLVEEILCRVPATSLKRLRSTCKGWNRLSKDDRRFARKHSDKAAKEFLALMLTKNFSISPMSVNLHGEIPSVEVKSALSLPDLHYNNLFQFGISVVFHCDGLLLCVCNRRIRMVVWNPFTGGVRWIQDYFHTNAKYSRIPSELVLGYCRDKDSCGKSYKILRYSRITRASQIYEFDSDSWRNVDYDIAPGWNIGHSFYADYGVSLKGNTYWFAKHETRTHLSLLRFDFSTEKSGPVPLPYQCDSYETSILSVVREEKLSVLLQREITSKTEIWVTNKIDETKVVSWTKVLALDLNSEFKIHLASSFLLDEEKKVVLCCVRWLVDEDETITQFIDSIYIVGEDNKVTLVDFGLETLTSDKSWPVIFSYVPNLVQIQRAEGIKRKRGHDHVL